MEFIERGTPGVKTTSSGWLARHFASASNLPAEIIMPSVSVGSTQSTSLLGDRDTINLTDPDSFNLHFFQEAMRGRPFAVLETDGHAGNAGTKTRVEAFLYCVHQDLASDTPHPAETRFKQFEEQTDSLPAIAKRDATILIPRMGNGAASLAALAEKPDLLGRALIMVGLAEGIAIYGLLIAFMVLNR